MDERDETPAGVPELGGQRGGRLADALERTVAAIGPGAGDAALVALLAAYARELDGADALAARARKVAEDVREQAPDGALDERVKALEAAVSKRSALVQIGSRFHSGLTELLATPKSRSAGKTPADRASEVEPADDEAASRPAQARRAALELLSGGTG